MVWCISLLWAKKPNATRLRSDEVGKAGKGEREGKGAAAKKDEGKDAKPKPPVAVKVDLDGIQDRLVAVEKIPAGDYTNLRMVDDRIFYLRRTVADDAAEEGDDPGGDNRKWHLAAYSLEDRKETVLGDVNGYEITADGKKMLVKIDKDYSIVELPKDKLETKDEKAGKDYKIKLEGLDMQLDRHAEWNQIYFDIVAAYARGLFLCADMHGVDWKPCRISTPALLPFVNHRNDLTISSSS